jgi:hypothetical protein
MTLYQPRKRQLLIKVLIQVSMKVHLKIRICALIPKLLEDSGLRWGQATFHSPLHTIQSVTRPYSRTGCQRLLMLSQSVRFDAIFLHTSRRSSRLWRVTLGSL